ncbi:MAG: methyltetrahydrofolate cobalamin methyltransferase [Coriobacteriales bacterium]|jgi:5-methyltetrahydrofolate--homocysteine methyltransferase|nr:methyltetrahydrofolate cobalamin methyltransferase [Coriobacteriales bacterium]
MIIIGEKINGFIPQTLAAIEAKDESYIRAIATSQALSHADYLDICAGVAPELERETMEWLIGLVQDETDTPLCLDSSDVELLLAMMQLVKKPGLLNSVSLEIVDTATGATKCDVVYPAIADTQWGVVALTCDNNGIPDDPQIKCEIACKMIEQAQAAGIAPERIYIDPLVTTLATKQDSLVNFTEGIRLIRQQYPTVHFTSGLSNISYGMPFRKAINMQFLSLAMAAGMDSAIMDPTSPDMQATLHATVALLGNDDFCMEYLTAYREGLFEKK